MGKLYAVEKEAREAGATQEQRLAMRQQRSAALFEELKAKITQIALHALPSSKLAEACHYALNQWSEGLPPGRSHRDRPEPLRERYADIGITFFMRRW